MIQQKKEIKILKMDDSNADPKCSFFGCTKKAVVSIPRANGFNCQLHWEVNLLRSGSPGIFKELPKLKTDLEKVE